VSARHWTVRAAALSVVTSVTIQASANSVRQGVGQPDLWGHDNLVAWCVVPFDAKMREPEARSQMLRSLGFRNFAYDWRDKDVPAFDAEIEAIQKYQLNLVAWWFPLDADNPLAKTILDTFKHHNIHPQLWVPLLPANIPKNHAELEKLLPKGFEMPNSEEELNKLSEADRTRVMAELQSVLARLRARDFPKTPEEQAQRVELETARIQALVTLAAPYGVSVELYNHNGWSGMVDNQLAIIARLHQMGNAGVGMVYNFSHSRDELHDDSKHFPQLWRRIKDYVVEVNVTGMRWEGQLVYPSEGDSEVAMMRAIQQSGWRGRIGLEAEKGGDAEVTLRNTMTGLDWLATELRNPGSGGPRPFLNAR
jgi:hypothetical protein